MKNSKLQYGDTSMEILLKTGIDDIFNKANGKGLDNILLEFAFKFMTMINGFKNFQFVTELKDINITTDNFTFQDIVDNVPEESICWFKIPATAEIVRKEAGDLLVLTSHIRDRETEYRPLPMLAFFFNPVTNIPWLRYYDGVGSDSFWYPLFRYNAGITLKNNFTGTLQLWQYGNIVWLTGNITTPTDITGDTEFGEFSSIFGPDLSIANMVEIPTGFGTIVISGSHAYLRKATNTESAIPNGTTIYVNMSWMAKCYYE